MYCAKYYIIWEKKELAGGQTSCSLKIFLFTSLQKERSQKITAYQNNGTKNARRCSICYQEA